MIKMLFTFCLLLIIVVCNPAQKTNLIEELSRIRLFVSNKSDVEKFYGQGTEHDTDTIYRLSRGKLRIVYSEKNCKSVPVGHWTGGLWNVPNGTVVDMSYSNGNETVKLKELKLNKKSYKLRETEGDVRGLFDYYDNEKGISITFEQETKEVLDIIFYPTKNDSAFYSCNE
jgi:hypothetical protein